MIRSRPFGLRAATFLLVVTPLFTASCAPDDQETAPRIEAGIGDGTTTDGEAGGVAPTFGGIRSLTSAGGGELAAGWAAATDDFTPQSQISYRIYLAPKPGGWDFTKPAATTAAGATSTILTGLVPGQSYSVVVHAVDTDGNEDTNTVHLEATTNDVTPPVFSGATALVGVDAHSVKVSWSPASDDGTPASNITYRVFVSDTAGGEDFSTPATTSAPGATSATVSGLVEAHTYYAVVRAVDASGNVDTNKHEVTGATLDKTPPVFKGCDIATATGTAVSLSWTAATDNVDTSSKIVYDIYRATTPAGEDYTKPTYTTVAGATSFVAISLTPSTKYYFVCRARDTSGNEDANKVERNATTAVSSDVTAPTFGGLVSITPTGTGGLTLDWAAATDDTTPASGIVYDIFLATSAAGEVYSTPTFSTAPGATTYTITGLVPSTRYYAVVRARDAAGNEETNTIERSAATNGDTTAPTFAGLVSATQTGPTTIRLTWAAATDDVSPPAAIRYRIYEGTSAGGESFASPVLTTGGGATSAVVSGLSPNKKYFFVAHAVDEAGNEDANLVEKSDTTAADTTPPTFGGVGSFTATAASTAIATWAPATDNVDASSAIVYELFLATSSGAETFLTPTATTAPGATSFTFTGLAASKPYFVIVRAKDSAGNVDANTVEKSTTTLADTTAPTFGGATGITGASATTLTVTWAAATDDVTPPSGIKYLICETTTNLGCSGASFTTTASVTGATSYTFTALTPSTTYYFVVRAQDAAGNTDNNSVQVSGVTVADAVPPVFGGLTSATATGDSSIHLSWTAATDNVSTPAQIVYDIYQATASGAESYASPTYSSAPGATSYDVTGLLPNKTYFFVVRARDLAGNRDANTTEKSATTSTDTTPPTFGGVTSVTAASDTQLLVGWSAATDDTTAPGSITYLVCVGATPTTCTTSFTTTASVTGATSLTVGGLGTLQASTTYYVVVRARDASLNTDANTVVKSGATAADSTPPTWGGGVPTVTPVYADGVATTGELNVGWTSGSTDDATVASSLRYVLCWSTSASGCNGASFSVMQTTPAAATTAMISGLSSATPYYVWVRVEDSVPNNDGGNHSANATTAVSYTNDINAKIFSAAPAAGGCNGGCHVPLWNRTNTYSQPPSPACSPYTLLVDPGHPTTSLIYEKMVTTTTLCGIGQMPQPPGTPSATNEQLMFDWITQNAHDN